MRSIIDVIGLEQVTLWSDECSEGRHILADNRIGANPGMLADDDRSDDFGSSPDIDIPTYGWDTMLSGPNCYLLKYQTINANLSGRMDNYTVRVRQEQAATYR